MKLTDVDLLKLLPQFMRDEKNTKAFAYAVENQIVAVSNAIEHARLYSKIDSLSDPILDELAWQFNLVEYRDDYDISIKRELIKGCMVQHYMRGTVESVEAVVRKIYGDATVEEWFEYGGEPYHFRIYTSNPESSDEMIQEVIKIVKETQNVRSHLESVIVEILQKMNLYIGCKSIIMDDVTLHTAEFN